MLQHRYYLYQRTFPIHEYGVWLEISYMKRFFVTAVYRVTTQSNVILVEGGVQLHRASGVHRNKIKKSVIDGPYNDLNNKILSYQ